MLHHTEQTSRRAILLLTLYRLASSCPIPSLQQIRVPTQLLNDNIAGSNGYLWFEIPVYPLTL
jgi:hypothetical protein